MENVVRNRKILVVEDDRAFLREISDFFRGGDNEVVEAQTLRDAIGAVKSESDLDAIILDVRLPDGNGLDLFREMSSLPPVVVLSVLGGEDSVMSGLNAGAIDYVVKPCSMKLLETRLSLRLLPVEEAELRFGDFTIDSVTRVAGYAGRPIALTSCEFNILHFLAARAGKFFSADEIYESVWHAPALQTTTIKRHLCTLRHKLKEAAPNEDLIGTEFGKGYCFIKRRQK